MSRSAKKDSTSNKSLSSASSTATRWFGRVWKDVKEKGSSWGSTVGHYAGKGLLVTGKVAWFAVTTTIVITFPMKVMFVAADAKRFMVFRDTVRPMPDVPRPGFFPGSTRPDEGIPREQFEEGAVVSVDGRVETVRYVDHVLWGRDHPYATPEEQARAQQAAWEKPYPHLSKPDLQGPLPVLDVPLVGQEGSYVRPELKASPLPQGADDMDRVTFGDGTNVNDYKE